MGKIRNITEAISQAKKYHVEGKKIVLAGGCFDILHIGHLTFLEQAHKKGDKLFVFLESDEMIRQHKGDNRPINNQKDRAKILSHLSMVDCVILLPPKVNDAFYDNLVIQLKPAIIATTAGDTYRAHKERQAEKIGATVVDVTAPISNQSTTKLVSLLSEL
jgi:FAD synthetase